MNTTKYQALILASRECHRDANLHSTVALGTLLWAIGATSLHDPVRLILSAVSVATAVMARESRSAAVDADRKKAMFQRQLDSLEVTEAALEFANSEVALKESYGFFEPEQPALPVVASPKATRVLEAPEADEPWQLSDDFGFAALAPDAKAEIRDWLDLDFACSSKIICAASGSGKSSYLRWEYRQSSQDRTTYLIDGHLLGNHLEGVTWTGSKESDLRVVSYTAYQIQRTLTDLIAEVRARLQGQRTLDPVHVLIDEADGNIFKVPEIQQLLHEFVVLVANEARKTKVTLSLVTHSVQKQKTGLDASDLVQIKWLIMGNALATPNSRWPGDLRPKEWLQKQQSLQATLDSDQARACVLYQQSGISLEILEKDFLK